jgi:hypothetical protein
MRPPEGNPAAKPLSVRQSELADLWVRWSKENRGPMPRWMREAFSDLFWEEQEERSREGRPLRIPGRLCPGERAVGESIRLGASPIAA